MHIAILIENPTKTTLNHSMSKRSLRENVNQRQLKPCKEGAYSVASLISVVTKKERKNKKNNKTKWSPQLVRTRNQGQFTLQKSSRKCKRPSRNLFLISIKLMDWMVQLLNTEKQSCKENQTSPKYSIHSYLVHFSYTNYAKTEKENR